MSKLRKFTPYAIIALGVVLVIAGFARNENLQILSKAVAVCLECIGIG